MSTDEFVPVETIAVNTKPGKAGLKAGLIGGAVVLALTLLSLIPVVGLGYCCSCLSILVYVGIGVLGSVFLTPPRQAGKGAGAGAVAGLIAGAIGGLTLAVIMLMQGASLEPDAILSAVPASQWEQLRQAGVDPTTYAEMFSQYYGYISAAVCCPGSLVMGAALGAIGGAIHAAAKKD